MDTIVAYIGLDWADARHSVHLQPADGRIEHWRLLRSKLGLGAVREFKVLIETRDLAQLDDAFTVVSTRADPVEEYHEGVNSLVTNFQAALWRDFPDPQRVTGQERF